MPVNYLRIPEELRLRKEWLVWRYEDRDGSKPTKPPYNPKSGKYADVTNPEDWVTFDEAVAAVSYAGSPYNGIGFVFSKDSPYCGVDLDAAKDQTQLDRQIAVVGALDSYAERSPSRNGLHVIVKATIPKGCRRDSIEIYDRDRFFTMTGDVYMDKLIRPAQHIIEPMYEAMKSNGGEKFYAVQDKPQSQSDMVVIDTALAAKNGAKFSDLHDGNWQSHYGSQSEADFAYINMIAFYTQNIEQIKRIFWDSPLGQRKKARRPDYVNSMVNRAFDNQLPPVDFIQVLEEKQQFENTIDAQNSKSKKVLGFDLMPIDWPPGFVGDIAQYIYSTSPRPVKEIAITASIGLMAGVCGRSYNISNTGLNMYLLMLAPSGVGKEAINSGTSRLVSLVASHIPAATGFIGPADFSSGQAILRGLESQPSTVTIVGEFGHKMHEMANPKAPSHLQLQKRVLLDLFNKSGAGDIFNGVRYASDSNSISPVKSPALSIVGESTPIRFYETVDETLIQDGLLPRFIILHYEGKRPALNKTHNAHTISPQLLNQLNKLCNQSLQLNANGAVNNIKIDPDAQRFLDYIDEASTAHINSLEQDSIRDLYNRLHLHVLKLSGLISIGINNYFPIVTLDIAQWAFNVAANSVYAIESRFNSGEVGGFVGENKQMNKIISVFYNYIQNDGTKLPDSMLAMHTHNCIPYRYIQSRVSNIKAFKEDRIGTTNALKRCMKNLVDGGYIVELNHTQVKDRFNCGGVVYQIIDAGKFAEASP